jgi:hypothetical protein
MREHDQTKPDELDGAAARAVAVRVFASLLVLAAGIAAVVIAVLLVHSTLAG